MVVAEAKDWIGTELAGGRYIIRGALGEGGMGLVFRAWDNNLSTEVVVKVPRPDTVNTKEFCHRFMHEVRSLVSLSHPHIVKILDVGEHERLPFAVLQFLAGGNLEQERIKLPDGSFRPVAAMTLRRWLPQIAEALDFIHAQGYIHRDVKPANILFDAHQNSYLSDFGVAKALAATADVKRTMVTGGDVVLGTPHYMAPEMVLGQTVDGRADQYALGVTVFEMLAGRHPIDGPTGPAIMLQHTTQPIPDLVEFVPQAPRELSAALSKALSKSVKYRFGSCHDFAAAVMAAVENLPQAVAAQTWAPAAASAPQHDVFACSGCGATFPLRQELVGKRVRCANCQTQFVVAPASAAGKPTPGMGNSTTQELAQAATIPPPPLLPQGISAPGNTQPAFLSQPQNLNKVAIGLVAVICILMGSIAVLWPRGTKPSKTVKITVPPPPPPIKGSGEKPGPKTTPVEPSDSTVRPPGTSPTSSDPPTVEIAGLNPKEPQEGENLIVRLAGERAVRFQYNLGSEWVDVQGTQFLLRNIGAATITLELQSIDANGQRSASFYTNIPVKPKPKPQPVAPTPPAPPPARLLSDALLDKDEVPPTARPGEPSYEQKPLYWYVGKLKQSFRAAYDKDEKDTLGVKARTATNFILNAASSDSSVVTWLLQEWGREQRGATWSVESGKKAKGASDLVTPSFPEVHAPFDRGVNAQGGPRLPFLQVEKDYLTPEQSPRWRTYDEPAEIGEKPFLEEWTVELNYVVRHKGTSVRGLRTGEIIAAKVDDVSSAVDAPALKYKYGPFGKKSRTRTHHDYDADRFPSLYLSLIAEVRSEGVADAVVQAIQNSSTRKGATFLLAQAMWPKESIPALTKLFDSEDFEVRYLALWLLGIQLSSPTGAPADLAIDSVIIPLCSDSVPTVRDSAAILLATHGSGEQVQWAIGDTLMRESSTLKSDDRFHIWQRFAPRAASPIAMLTELLDKKVITPSTALCDDLMNHRPEGIYLLIQLSKYKPPVEVRKKRIQHLCSLGDNISADGIAAIVEAVHDESLSDTFDFNITKLGPNARTEVIRQLRVIVGDSNQKFQVIERAKRLIQKLESGSKSPGAKSK